MANIPDRLRAAAARWSCNDPQLLREAAGEVERLHEVIRHCAIGEAPDEIRRLFDQVNGFDLGSRAMQLRNHSTRRLRTLSPGDTLVVVEPVEPQPPAWVDQVVPETQTGAIYLGLKRGSPVWQCRYPHRPGDVVEVVCEFVEHRLRLSAQPKCKPARELMANEWAAADAQIEWDETHGHREYDWDRDWVWVETWEVL